MAGGSSKGPASSYVGAVQAHPLVAIIVFLATLAGCAAYLGLRTEQYEATAEVLVTPLPVEEQGLLGIPVVTEAPDATRVSQTAAALLRNNRAAAQTARQLGPGWTRNEVLDAMAVAPRGESNVIALTATADGAALSARVANVYTLSALDVRRDELGAVIPQRIQRLEAQIASGIAPAEQNDLRRRIAGLRAVEQSGDPTLSLAQRAVIPTSSSSPSVVLVAAGGLLAAVVLAFGAALAVAVMNRRLHDEDELFSVFPLPILARIPDSGRRAAKAQAAEAFRTLLLELQGLNGPSKVIMVTSGSSGDGKTTSAMQLALAARETGSRVVYLDFDVRERTPVRLRRRARQQRSFGLDTGDPDLPRLEPGGRLGTALITPYEDPDLTVAIPPAHDDLAGLAALTRELPRFISEARSLADVVIVDTSPLGEVGDALRLLEHVDRVLVVVRLGHTRRAAFKLVRDLTLRARRAPEGLVVIGATPTDTSASYHRELSAAGARVLPGDG